MVTISEASRDATRDIYFVCICVNIRTVTQNGLFLAWSFWIPVATTGVFIPETSAENRKWEMSCCGSIVNVVISSLMASSIMRTHPRGL